MSVAQNYSVMRFLEEPYWFLDEREKDIWPKQNQAL